MCLQNRRPRCRERLGLHATCRTEEDLVLPGLLNPLATVVAASCYMLIADDAIHVFKDVFLHVINGTLDLFQFLAELLILIEEIVIAFSLGIDRTMKISQKLVLLASSVNERSQRRTTKVGQ